MALHRALNPELVLCGSCRDQEENESRWTPYMDEDNNNALLVRDVCSALKCPNLQVRNHFCVDHVLEYECAWQGMYQVRCCHVCRTGILQLYQDKQEVWLILRPNELNRHALGVERVWKTPTGTVLRHSTPQRSNTRSHGKRPRRSLRPRGQTKEKEWTRALEWSKGMIPKAEQLYLWKENKRRREAAPSVYVPPSITSPDPVNIRPDPTAVFCVVQGCQHFAKTGDCCRFHSKKPLIFKTSPLVSSTAATSSISTSS